MNTIKSRVALHTATENFFHGYKTNEELLGKETGLGFLAIAIKGVRPSEQEREILDTIVVAINSSDPRIWPLKLSRVAASYGSFPVGLTAGFLGCDNVQLGPIPTGKSAETLAYLKSMIGDRLEDQEFAENTVRAFLKTKPRIMGLGVPLRDFDERYVPFVKWINEKGYNTGYYWKLHLVLSKLAEEVFKIKTNILLGCAAILLDLGYEPKHVGPMMLCLTQPSMAANAFEGSIQKEEHLQKLPVESVEYVGKPSRVSPRKLDP